MEPTLCPRNKNQPINYLTQALLIFILGSLCQSCHFYKIPKLAKQGEVQTTEYLEETAFEFSRDLIFVDVLIKGKTYNFVFDTGAELSVIGQHIADDIDYEVVTSSKVKATQKKSESKIEFARIPKMSIGSVMFENTGAIIADIAHFDEVFGCRSIDGIIGNNLMRKASWQIDYKNETLRISDNAQKFEISEKASALTMDAGKIRNVFFDVTIDSVASKFAFDTGCSCSISADSTLFSKLKAKNAGLQYSTESGIASMDLHGRILNRTFNTMTKSIDIEGVLIPDQIISLSGSKSISLLGNQIYKNFTLTIDWVNDKLYLDPTSSFKADTLKGYEFSFAPNYRTLKIEIVNFQDDHPMVEPISLDATILQINGVEVSHFTLDELCAYWDRESENFKTYGTLDMVVLDQGLERKITLTEKVLLPKG